MKDTLKNNQAIQTLAKSVGLEARITLADRSKFQLFENGELLGSFDRVEVLTAIIARA